MSERQQSFIVKIPTGYDADQRQNIGEDIVQFIVNRTKDGLDRFGKPFPKYSESYASSLEFKVGGKRKDRPNLTLTGDMLISLRVLRHFPGSISIGFPEGSDENDRAAWVARAERGGREVLGIMPADLDAILSNYPLDERTPSAGFFEGVANEFLRRIRT